MKNFLAILLTLAVAAAGFLLPEWLLREERLPTVELEASPVQISSDTSSDYVWRMQQLADDVYGDRADLLSTYIGMSFSEEQLEELHAEFVKQLELLAQSSVVDSELVEWVTEAESRTVNCYYLFDGTAVNGLRMAQLRVGTTHWNLTAHMDLESGKLSRLTVSGTPGYLPTFRPRTVYSWYDMLRGYADYLGLAQANPQLAPGIADSPREYYETITADRLCAAASSGGWLETRILQDNTGTTLCVFRAGK